MTGRATMRGGVVDARETAGLYLAVSLGSAIGSVSRALVSLAAVAWLTGPGGRIMASTRQRQFVMTGFCGGFTTFSAFSLEALMLVQTGRLPLAGLYIALSVAAWLAAARLGQALATRSNRI